MPFLLQQGCCGSSLQRTCLIMSIILLIDVTTSTIFEAIFVDSALLSYVLIVGIISIAAAACLLLATILENKYLCIPFFIAFVISIVDCIYWIITIILTVSPYDNIFKDETEAIVVTLVGTALTVVVSLVLLLYVISYFNELGGV